MRTRVGTITRIIRMEALLYGTGNIQCPDG